MKILMATMGLDIGGAETHIVELAKELKAEGHDVAIASNGGVYVPEIKAAGIRHYSVPMHRRNVRYMRRSRKLLKEIIQKEKPDVVHAHARIPAFLCGTLHATMHFPFVTTAHWVFETRGMLRYLTNWGQRTVAVSEDIKAYLMREYGVPEEHITVTVNGIDTNKFSPEVSRDKVMAELGLDPQKPVISYVSRMDEDRALVARQLVQVARDLDREVPGIQLIITGGGNVFDEIKAQADQVNADLGRTCVVMTGPRTDINEIVAAGDLFVGVSRSALEAMSAAKPVIVAGNEGYQGLFGPDKLEEDPRPHRGVPAGHCHIVTKSDTCYVFTAVDSQPCTECDSHCFHLVHTTGCESATPGCHSCPSTCYQAQAPTQPTGCFATGNHHGPCLSPDQRGVAYKLGRKRTRKTESFTKCLLWLASRCEGRGTTGGCQRPDSHSTVPEWRPRGLFFFACSGAGRWPEAVGSLCLHRRYLGSSL